MPEKPFLLIYVGEDFLFPTVFDAGGTACSMKTEASRYFWLYFNASSTSPDYAYEYKIKVANQESGYYGDFLKKCAAKEKVLIDGADHDYFNLIKYSGLTDSLRDLFVKYARMDASTIDTAYVFAESIPDEQRKVFIQGMMRCGFQPIAYSVLLSEVIMDYISQNNRLLKPVLGDRVLILNSVNDKLVLTDAVFDGETWMSDGTCHVEERFGDSPIKDALVRYVIRTVDQSRSFLHNDSLLQEEFEFQRSNADKWMGLPRFDGDIHIADFHYKSYGGPFSCSVSDKIIERETELALNRIVSNVTDYINNRIGKNLIMTVFTGVAFEDKALVEKMVWGLNISEYRVITASLMPDVFSRYVAKFGDERGNFSRFDREMATLRTNRQSVSAWGASAAEIRNLRIQIKAAVETMEQNAQTEIEHYEQMLKACDTCLEQSKFQQATEKLTAYPLPGEPMLIAIKKANEQADAAKRNQHLFDSVSSIRGARSAIEDIGNQVKRINELIRQSDDREAGLRKCQEQIDYYQLHYDEYIRLKNLFNSPDVPVPERRSIWEKMKPLTKEPLPELVLQHVRVRLNSEIRMVRKCLFSKKKLLSVRLDVLEGGKLPCPAVMNIMGSMPIEAMEESSTCICLDIPQGESSFVHEFDLSEEKRIQEGTPLYIAVFTDKHQIDTDAILNEEGNDKPYLRINKV